MTGVELRWDGRDEPPAPTVRPLVIDETAGAAPDNLLIHGENLDALAALTAYRGTIELAYIDPPFDSGRSYSAQLDVGPAQPAYADSYGTAAYLQMLEPRLRLIHGLLAPAGVLCVHTDNHAGNYVGVLLDEIFGQANFVNEIIWRYGKMANATRRFANNHDRILVYAKSGGYHFTPARTAESEYRTRFARYLVDNKVHYAAVAASADKLVLRRVRQVARTLGRDLVGEDVLFDFDTEFKAQDDVFYDISIVKGNAAENVGFRTQKPLTLLERLITAYSPPGALVLDCFAGSGTTAVAAIRTGRRFIAIDSGRFAVHTARRRLLAAGAQFAVVDHDGPPYSAATVSVETVWSDDARHVEVRLAHVALPDGPGEAWVDLVDYWAVDFGGGRPFRIDWYALRGSADAELALTAAHDYAEPGPHPITVRVVDLNARTVEVTV